MRALIVVACLLNCAWAAPALKATQVWRVAHEPQLTDLRWSGDGSTVSGCIDGREVVVWDARTGALRLRQAHPRCLWVALTANGRFAAWVQDGSLRVVDVDSGERVAELADVRSVRLIAHAERSNAFAIATDKTVKIWTAPATQPAAAFPIEEEGVDALRFSKDGRRLTAIVRRNFTKKTRDRLKRPVIKALVWDVARGAIRSRRKTKPPTQYRWTHRDPSRAVARVIEAARKTGRVDKWLRAPRGQSVLITVDGKHTVWDRTRRTRLAVLEGQTHPSNRIVAMSPTSDQVAVGGHDGTVRIYRVGKPVQVLGKHPHYVRSLAFSPDGKWLASGGHTEWAVWDLKTGAQVHRGDEGGYAMAFDSTSSALAIQLSPLTVFSVGDWTVLKTLDGYARLSTAPNGILVAFSDPTGTSEIRERLNIIRAPDWTAKPLRPAHVHPDIVALRPDGYVVGPHHERHSTRPGLRVWAPDAPKPVKTWDHPHRSGAVALGPHGWVASLEWVYETSLSQVHLWHPEDGRTQTLAGQHVPNQSAKTRLFFGDGGKGLVAFDRGGGVTYWRIETVE